jgi:propanol-preferring alcohol dehydrogenase
VVHVLTRSAQARELALALGAASAGPADGEPPEPLDAAVLFAPAGELVPVAMRRPRPGRHARRRRDPPQRRPVLNYARELFREKQLRSITANTRADGEEFLRLAAALEVRPTVDPRPLDEADRALADLAADKITGAAVLLA